MKPSLHLVKKIANRTLGMLSDKLFWKFRDILDPKWPESYIAPASLSHPHRVLLIETIAAHAPFETALEIGCASGPNLVLLARRFSQAALAGIDINARAIRVGTRFLNDEHLHNVRLSTGGFDALSKIPDRSYDIVFTDAVLIYADAAHIGHIMAECARIAKKAVVLCEWNTGKPHSFLDGHWVHNYASFFPGRKIEVKKIPDTMWSGAWTAYGAVVDVSLTG